MKRLLAFIFALVMTFGATALPAAAKTSLKTEVNVTGEYTYEITLSVEGSFKASSLGVDFAALQKKMTVEKGKWLVSDALLSDVDLKGGAAVAAFATEKTVKGDIFLLTVSSTKKPSFEKVSLEVVYDNGKSKLTATLSEKDFLEEPKKDDGANKTPAANDTPAENDTPAANDTPAENDTPAVSDLPLNEGAENEEALPATGETEGEKAPVTNGNEKEGLDTETVLIFVFAGIIVLGVVGIIILRKKMP